MLFKSHSKKEQYEQLKTESATLNNFLACDPKIDRLISLRAMNGQSITLDLTAVKECSHIPSCTQ